MNLDDTPAGDLETEVGRLALALHEAREARVMAALWGSRDEHCPRAFSLYRHEDVTGVSGEGTVAYGAQFADGTVVVRWSGPTASTVMWASIEDAVKIHGHDGRTRVVWLSEDLDDLTETIADDIRREYRERAKSDAVRVAVAEAISKADPVDSTWQECLELADAALTVLFAPDDHDHDHGERGMWTLAAGG